jgi:hypothetical protein
MFTLDRPGSAGPIIENPTFFSAADMAHFPRTGLSFWTTLEPFCLKRDPLAGGSRRSKKI